QRRSSRILTGRVPDHPGEITDQEHHVVTELLKMPQLVDQHSVTKMQIRRSRIKTCLDTQRTTCREPFDQLALHQQLFRATLDALKRPRDIDHATLPSTCGSHANDLIVLHFHESVC